MVAKWFKPSPAAGLLMLMGLGFQGLLTTTAISTLFAPASGPSSRYEQRVTSVGLPTFVVITQDNTLGMGMQTGVQFRWLRLLAVLLTVYLVGAALGRAITPPGRAWRPVIVLGIMIGVVAMVAFVAAVGLSRWYWGYWMAWPELDPRVAQATAVWSVTPFQSRQNGSTFSLVLGEAEQYDDALLQSVREPLDPTYRFTGRELLALAERKVLPVRPPTLPVEKLAPLHALMDQTGYLRSGEAGYTGAKSLHGRVIEFTAAGGEAMLFISAMGGQVSNDHYPYYEFLFAVGDGGAGPALLSCNRFYYDVAGMEGMTWLGVWVAFMALGLVVALPIAVLIMAVRQWRAQRRLALRGFAVEAHATENNRSAGPGPVP